VEPGNTLETMDELHDMLVTAATAANAERDALRDWWQAIHMWGQASAAAAEARGAWVTARAERQRLHRAADEAATPLLPAESAHALDAR
jgi:hypothetical protein